MTVSRYTHKRICRRAWPFGAWDARATRRPVPKADERGADLLGSTFKLFVRNASGVWETVGGYDSIDLTESVRTPLLGLQAGLYRLDELQAPDGYVLLDKSVYFKISPDGSVGLTDEAGTGPNTNAQANIATAADATVITVKNIPGAELPATGGMGTEPFMLLGSVIALGAVAYLLMAARRVGSRR